MDHIRNLDLFPEVDKGYEQRQEPRYFIDQGCECEMEADGSVMRFTVENISRTGLLIATTETGLPFAKGDRVRIATRCRETDACLAEAEGVVVRMSVAGEGTRLGIEYDRPLGLHKVGCHVLANIPAVDGGGEQ